MVLGRAAGEAPHPLGRSVGPVLFFGGILLIGTQSAVAGFGDSDQLRFIHLAALMWHTCVAGVMFGARVLRSIDRAG